MKAAETSASSAIADCTQLAVVSRSCTTAEIDTFISEVSTTSTNIAIARRTASVWSPLDSSGVATVASAVTRRAYGPLRAGITLVGRDRDQIDLRKAPCGSPVRARRDAELALERLGERRVVPVSGEVGDLVNRQSARAEIPRRL